MIKDDDICVCFMNAATREAFDALPDSVVVITELLNDDQIIVTKEEEFLNWLLGDESEDRECCHKKIN